MPARSSVTGISFMTAEMGAKLLGLLHELVPQAARFVALVNPTSSFAEPFVKDLRESAQTLGLQAEVLYAGDEREIEAAFVTLVQKRADALLIAPDALFTSRRAQLATLSLRHAVPSTHVIREFAEAGGPMSYGPNLANAYQQTGIYTGRILKGEKPADLPVAQPIKFELVINLDFRLEPKGPSTLPQIFDKGFSERRGGVDERDEARSLRHQFVQQPEQLCSHLGGHEANTCDVAARPVKARHEA